MLLQRKLSLPAIQALSSMFPFIRHIDKFLSFKITVCDTHGSDEFLWGLVSLTIEVGKASCQIDRGLN